MVISSNQIIPFTAANNKKNFRAICAEPDIGFPNGLIVISWVQYVGMFGKEDIMMALFDGSMNMINSPHDVSDPSLGTHHNNNQHISFSEDQDFVILVWESAEESFDGGVTWQSQ